MKIADFFKYKSKANTAVTIGMFDGVHLGHQKILKTLQEKAAKDNLKSVVVTFSNNPKAVVSKTAPPLIMALDQRLELIKEVGIETCLLIDFNKKVASITAKDFLEKHLIQRLKMKAIVLGKNFRFGAKTRGDFEFLKKYSNRYQYSVSKTEAVRRANNTIVSSTLIRKNLEQGNLKQAEKLLGRPFYLFGKVIGGDKIGRKLGFPTANLNLFHDYLVPQGVYAGECNLDSHNYRALVSIGTKPTFSKSNKVFIEIHLLDFKKNLYNKNIKIALNKKIRSQKKFQNREELIAQIKKDLLFLKSIKL